MTTSDETYLQFVARIDWDGPVCLVFCKNVAQYQAFCDEFRLDSRDGRLRYACNIEAIWAYSPDKTVIVALDGARGHMSQVTFDEILTGFLSRRHKSLSEILAWTP